MSGKLVYMGGEVVVPELVRWLWMGGKVVVCGGRWMVRWSCMHSEVVEDTRWSGGGCVVTWWWMRSKLVVDEVFLCYSSWDDWLNVILVVCGVPGRARVGVSWVMAGGEEARFIFQTGNAKRALHNGSCSSGLLGPQGHGQFTFGTYSISLIGGDTWGHRGETDGVSTDLLLASLAPYIRKSLF